MQSIYEYAWIVPILPCLSASILAIGLLSLQRATHSLRSLSGLLSIGLIGIAMMLSLGIFWEQIETHVSHTQLWPWLQVGPVKLEFGYIIDPLSSIMLVLVTTVGLAVMIYTDGYMLHDRGYVRFFAYLSLFTASMLGLVLSPNLIQVYAFWELVGMCSYLLVGFWFTRPSAATACQKAFITNRIGDFGLLLGILGFYWITGSFDFDTISNRFHQLILNNNIDVHFAILCGILLFLGPMAKSAQFPLHVWLPDAMEGPTPISALIHAATMVAAGIFLVARLLPLFQDLPVLMDLIAFTGVTTAFLGATLALAQRDLKRGLAYSTMSQLGYMMLALGIGSYQAGLFHLITHAYSKALLFLGSGSVIHGMEPVVGYNPNKSQDMGYMGGIRKYMPVTGFTFLLGTLSLCGIPPFACFWSKDEILAESWSKMPLLGFIAWITAGLTAFYMFRMYFLTFEGEFRGNIYDQENVELDTMIVKKSPNYEMAYPHESNSYMVAPLVALSVPTVFIGLLGGPFPSGSAGNEIFAAWLNTHHGSLNGQERDWLEFAIESCPSVGIALTGIFIAWLVYGPSQSRNFMKFLDPHAEGVGGNFLKFIYAWSIRRGYIDEIYEQVLVSGNRVLSKMTYLLDQWVIDGVVNNSGLLSLFGGESLRFSEGGRTTSYIFGIAIFTLLLLMSFFIQL
jgi:NAD(P)H-quinone oxidoreductase subunit 5